MKVYNVYTYIKYKRKPPTRKNIPRQVPSFLTIEVLLYLKRDNVMIIDIICVYVQIIFVLIFI